MVLTLLVDLDDTLLGNAMEIFIPAYLQALGEHLAEVIAPEKMVASMLAATRTMSLNQKPDRTLKETFDSRFYPAIGISEPSLRDQISQFYDSVFPSLERYTQYRPKARKFIDNAIERGYRVGIATNPLFPRTAVLQRLKWAGFPEDKFQFALIPSYETFHFAKPDPAYFAEFLTRIGWPNDPIVMVGNDPDHDINGSNRIGISSFWIKNDEENYPEGFPKPDGIGTLDEVQRWIDSQNPDMMIPDFNSPSAMKAILHGTPAGLSTIFSRLEQNGWPNYPEELERKLSNIACRLRDVEREVNLPQLKKTMKGKIPSFPGIDLDKSLGDPSYPEQDPLEAFSSYIDARLETLEILEKLDENDWWMETNHKVFSSKNLGEIVHTMISSEIYHSRKVFEIMSLFLSVEQASQATQ